MSNELIKSFSADERLGFSNVVALLAELYPSHDVWDGVLGGGVQTIIFGSNNRAIQKQNKPAFGIYKKPGMHAPVFGLRFDDKELRTVVAETLGDDSYLIRFPLTGLTSDVSGLRVQIEAWSQIAEIAHRMAGAGKDLLDFEELNNEATEWLDDVRGMAMQRRGQLGFRNRVLDTFDRKCAVTGCSIESVLEACHIITHTAKVNYSASNGLLLRSDLHRLFDCGLMAIDKSGVVHLQDPVGEDPSYRQLHGKVICFPAIDKASMRSFKDALALRFFGETT